jgi:transcriptional regulator with XRE-family HTH domain
MKGNARRLRELLKVRGWSQRDLARLLEVEALSIWRYCSNMREPSKKIKKKLEKKLGFVWEV